MKTVAYIDGQNFLYKVASVLIKAGVITDKQDLTTLDIAGLMREVMKDADIEIRFYGVGKIRRRPDLGPGILEKSRKFSDNLRRVRNSLARQHITYIESGKLKVRDSDVCKKCGNHDYRFQEKGVDVGIAVDVVADAILKEVGKIVLVNSDTDLIPAIKRALKAGVEVEYVGFETGLTPGLVAIASRTIAMTDAQIIRVYESANPQETIDIGKAA